MHQLSRCHRRRCARVRLPLHPCPNAEQLTASDTLQEAQASEHIPMPKRVGQRRSLYRAPLAMELLAQAATPVAKLPGHPLIQNEICLVQLHVGRILGLVVQLFAHFHHRNRRLLTLHSVEQSATHFSSTGNDPAEAM
eukprot:1266751-Rhodomonas_salina.1